MQASPQWIDMVGVNSYKDGVVTRLLRGLKAASRVAKSTVVEAKDGSPARASSPWKRRLHRH